MLNYDFDWSILTRPQFVDLLVDGTLRTVALAVVSGVLSFALGALLALARTWPSSWVNRPADVAVEVVRNVPALFWVLFFYFVLPDLLPQALGHRLHAWPDYVFAAAAMGLTLDNGAYLSDILRNGMAKVPRGQREAAANCGMSVWQESLCILCPQSLRTMMPAIANRMIHNFKNTSLCVAISLPELSWATQQIESITFKGLEVTMLATAVYATGSLALACALSRCFPAPAATAGDNAPDHHARAGERHV